MKNSRNVSGIKSHTFQLRCESTAIVPPLPSLPILFRGYQLPVEMIRARDTSALLRSLHPIVIAVTLLVGQSLDAARTTMELWMIWRENVDSG